MGNCTSGFTQYYEPPVVKIREYLHTKANLWTNGEAPVVKANGPGNLYLLSIPDPLSGIRHVSGYTSTSKEHTEFLIGFSHYFHTFIFYWDGRGDAFLKSDGTEKQRLLGRSWRDAMQVTRDGMFAKVSVEELNDPKTADNSATTVYTIPMPVLFAYDGNRDSRHVLDYGDFRRTSRYRDSLGYYQDHEVITLPDGRRAVLVP